jgi:hypothetical protein
MEEVWPGGTAEWRCGCSVGPARSVSRSEGACLSRTSSRSRSKVERPAKHLQLLIPGVSPRHSGPPTATCCGRDGSVRSNIERFATRRRTKRPENRPGSRGLQRENESGLTNTVVPLKTRNRCDYEAFIGTAGWSCGRRFAPLLAHVADRHADPIGAEASWPLRSNLRFWSATFRRVLRPRLSASPRIRSSR